MIVIVELLTLGINTLNLKEINAPNFHPSFRNLGASKIKCLMLQFCLLCRLGLLVPSSIVLYSVFLQYQLQNNHLFEITTVDTQVLTPED